MEPVPARAGLACGERARTWVSTGRPLERQGLTAQILAYGATPGGLRVSMWPYLGPPIILWQVFSTTLAQVLPRSVRRTFRGPETFRPCSASATARLATAWRGRARSSAFTEPRMAPAEK